MSTHRLVALVLLIAASVCGADAARAVCLRFGDPHVDGLEAVGLRASGDDAAAVGDAIALAQRRGDRLQEARLWAAVATRRIPLGDRQRVEAAVGASQQALAALDRATRTGAAARRVRQRLELTTASLAVTPAEMPAALARIEALLATLGGGNDDDNVRACALLARALLRSDQGNQRFASEDAMTAYRLAESGGFGFARADAAIMLATAYRRAGLTGPASRFIEDAIARAPVVGPPGMLARARYVESQVRLDAREFDGALESLEVARAIWRKLGNRFGQTASEQMACAIAMERGDRPAAVGACAQDEAALLRAGRPDMVVIQRAYAALVALDRGAMAEARRLIDSALALGASATPRSEARLLAIRSRIREAEGRWREALADAARSAELERIARSAERAHAALLFDASLVAERALQDNRSLRRAAQRTSAELAQHKLVRNLWAAAAIAAIAAVASMLALLLVQRTRQARERRARAIVATLAANSPDALLLVGADGQIQAANRGLFGGAAPAAGLPLGDAIPASTRTTTLGALARATQSRVVETAEVMLGDARDARTFELKCAPIVDDGRLLGATLRATDVTEARRIERLAAAVAARQRVRVAGELHEGIGQELAGIAMLLSSLSRQARRGGQGDADALDAAAAALMRSVDQTRGLARDVAPVVVARRSLRDALEQLGTSPSASAPHHLAYASTAQLSDAVADELFRTVSEIVGHRRAVAGGSVTTRVEDAAGGFVVLTVDVQAANSAPGGRAEPGLDLAMVGHRIRALGGKLEVEHPHDAAQRLRIKVRSRPDPAA